MQELGRLKRKNPTLSLGDIGKCFHETQCSLHSILSTDKSGLLSVFTFSKI